MPAKKKKKWLVTARVVGSKYVGTFEAETAEEAEQMAWDSDGSHVGLCHACAHKCEDAEIDKMHVEPAK